VAPGKIAGIVLVAGGVLGLIYGSFTYTSETHDVDLGVAELSWSDKETVQVPIWAGVVAIVAGAGLLFFGKRG
jgi:hypothetical protein